MRVLSCFLSFAQTTVPVAPEDVMKTAAAVLRPYVRTYVSNKALTEDAIGGPNTTPSKNPLKIPNTQIKTSVAKTCAGVGVRACCQFSPPRAVPRLLHAPHEIRPITSTLPRTKNGGHPSKVRTDASERKKESITLVLS